MTAKGGSVGIRTLVLLSLAPDASARRSERAANASAESSLTQRFAACTCMVQ
jgi:hypothetical protein